MKFKEWIHQKNFQYTLSLVHTKAIPVEKENTIISIYPWTNWLRDLRSAVSTFSSRTRIQIQVFQLLILFLFLAVFPKPDLFMYNLQKFWHTFCTLILFHIFFKPNLFLHWNTFIETVSLYPPHKRKYFSFPNL